MEKKFESALFDTFGVINKSLELVALNLIIKATYTKETVQKPITCLSDQLQTFANNFKSIKMRALKFFFHNNKG